MDPRGRRWGYRHLLVCATCGATVVYAVDGIPEARIIPVGAFADPEFPAPTVDVYTARRHPWVELRGDIEHWE